MNSNPVQRSKNGGLFAPTILIGLGVIFLLHNFGLVQWNPWSLLLRFWPIILVAAGLDMLFFRRSLSTILALVLLTILLLGGLGLIFAGVDGHLGQTLQPRTIDQPLNDATVAEVTIRVGAGTLTLNPLPIQSERLISGTVYLDPEQDPEPQYRQVHGRAFFVVRGESLQAVSLLRRWDADPGWRLQLNQDIPLYLTVRTGVGLSQLDLTDLQLVDLRVVAGIGQTTIVLPAAGGFSGDIRGSVGDVIVEIPSSLAVRVHSSSGLVDTQIEGSFQKVGAVYETPGFAQAANRVELTVDSDLGQIVIRQIALPNQ